MFGRITTAAGLEDGAERVERCGEGADVAMVDAAQVHYVGTVVALFMLFLVACLVAEYLWTVYVARTRPVRLEGDERALTVECDGLMSDQR